ncbi:MAG: M28 family peptidase [Candidatus Zixiibacteriota bacterium]
MRLVTYSLAVSLMMAFGCSTGTVTLPNFDGTRALGFLEKQVSFGPRVPGTTASATCRNYYYEYFRSKGLTVDSQVSSFFDPYSTSTIPLVNVVAHVTGTKPGAGTILLAAHYDSRPRTDFPSDASLSDLPIQGANDGASGVAVLMELAELFMQRPPEANIDLVLLDGEDWGKEGETDLYCLGAKSYASQGIHGRYRFAIVVDMVGDKDQRIYREGYTEMFNRSLNDMIWNAARDLKLTTFADSTKHAVIDDHLSLNAGGVPSAVIIDFDYAYWHTDQDTPDKCSAESLANVGRVLAHIVYNPGLWAKY